METSSKYTLVVSYQKYRPDSISVVFFRHSDEVFYTTERKSVEPANFMLLEKSQFIIQGLDKKALIDRGYLTKDCQGDSFFDDDVRVAQNCMPRLHLADRYVLVRREDRELFDIETELLFLKSDSSVETNGFGPMYLVMSDDKDGLNTKRFIDVAQFKGEGDVMVEETLGLDNIRLVSTWFNMKNPPPEPKKDDPVNPSKLNYSPA